MGHNIPFAAGIFRNMNDGVVVLDMDGLVTATNPAATDILNLNFESTAGKSFARSIPAVKENDAFLQTLLDSVYENTTVHNRIAEYFGPDDVKRILSVTASHLRDESGKLTGAVLVLRDVTETEQLRAAEHKLNAELTKALREVDESNRTLKTSLQQGHRTRLILTLATLLFFAGLGAYFWTSGSSAASSGNTAPTDARKDHDAPDTMVVASAPLTRSISLSGTVAPLRELTLSAPFQGKIKSVDFYYGDRTERNRTLIVLSTDDIETQLRDARSEYIKARKNMAEMERWEQAPDAAKARRDVQQARMQLKRAESKAEEDNVLLEQGIIPQSEYDTSAQDLKDKEMQLVSARENYQSVLAKGDEEYREIAQLELANAEAKMKAAESKVAQAVITAPVSGIVIRPRTGDKDVRDIAAGTSVTEGQPLLSISSLEGLSITAQVDELEINSLETGQAVLVSGDAFPDVSLKGRIDQLSSQADSDGQVPTFKAVVRLEDIPEEVKRKVRIGMSANMQVETYSNPEALLVPLDAVATSGKTSRVRVLNDDGTIRDAEVTTGYTTLKDVEILSGIEPGMKIVLDASES